MPNQKVQRKKETEKERKVREVVEALDPPSLEEMIGKIWSTIKVVPNYIWVPQSNYNITMKLLGLDKKKKKKK